MDLPARRNDLLSGIRAAEKRPQGDGWGEVRWPLPGPTPRSSAWRRGPIVVLSELVWAELPDGGGEGPQWTVSVSANGKRPKPKQVRRALRAFGMVGAEEDNHYPGVARGFWRPMDPSARVACQCKFDEQTIRDYDGYEWTTPANPGEGCRGCDYERWFGHPCPVHSK